MSGSTRGGTRKGERGCLRKGHEENKNEKEEGEGKEKGRRG